MDITCQCINDLYLLFFQPLTGLVEFPSIAAEVWAVSSLATTNAFTTSTSRVFTTTCMTNHQQVTLTPQKIVMQHCPKAQLNHSQVPILSYRFQHIVWLCMMRCTTHIHRFSLTFIQYCKQLLIYVKLIIVVYIWPFYDHS